MEFVDTNIILRYLTKDDLVKADCCFAPFQSAKRKDVRLVTSESVLGELVYVLSSCTLNHAPRTDERTLLWPIVSLPAL